MENKNNASADEAAASLSFMNEMLRGVMQQQAPQAPMEEEMGEEVSQNEDLEGEGSGMEATQEMQSPTEEMPTPTQETDPIEEEGIEVEEEKPDFESFKEELMKELDKKFEGLTESIKDTLSK